jgi:hypothetical protein
LSDRVRESLEEIVLSAKQGDPLPLLIVDPNDQYGDLETLIRRKAGPSLRVVRRRFEEDFAKEYAFYRTVDVTKINPNMYIEEDNISESATVKGLLTLWSDLIAEKIEQVVVKNGISLKSGTYFVDSFDREGSDTQLTLLIKAKCVVTGKIETIVLSPKHLDNVQVSLFGYKVFRDETVVFQKYYKNDLLKEIEEFYE